MHPFPRKASLEIQVGADALLAPGGGGIAVWVRRDEMMPRVAMRLSTKHPGGEDVSVTQLASILAALHIGVHRMTQALADQMNMPRETLDSMVCDARTIMTPYFEAQTNIVRPENKP